MSTPPGRSVRRRSSERKPREERWPELLKVATQIFYEKGYDATSLQDIANRMGMLKGSLYYYIRTKEDLLLEVLGQAHRDGMVILGELAEEPGTAQERLHRVIAGHVQHVCLNLVKTSVFLHEVPGLSPESREQILGTDHSYRELFATLIREGEQDGSIDPEINPTLAALSILGSINWVYRWYQPSGPLNPEDLGEQMATMIIGGLSGPVTR